MDKLAPVEIPSRINTDTIIKAMQHDKKSENDKINFVIPVSRREVEISNKIDINILNNEIVKFFTNR